MSARVRKTRDVWYVYVHYGVHGWEHETTEFTRQDAREVLKTYRANCPYPVKAVKRREPIVHTFICPECKGEVCPPNDWGMCKCMACHLAFEGQYNHWVNGEYVQVEDMPV
jgi:hypothetical protein